MARRDLSIEYLAIGALTPRANNPRTHSDTQIRQIAESITAFGWTNPILVDDDNGVIAGHGRLEAAKQLGLDAVPVVRLSGMSEAQKRAYVIADNKLAENAGWDDDLLRLELGALIELDLEFDIGVIGFETGEIDALFSISEPEPERDIVDEPSEQPAVSQPGDVWVLGRHRLVCGDALRTESYKTVLAGSKADAVFTDPPYNVPIDGHVCGLGAVKHAEFAMASGEMSEAEFAVFLATVCQRLVAASRSGSIHFICMDWRHIEALLAAGREHYTELKNLCVWSKETGGMGSLYRSQHELVAVFKAGKAKHVNNVELGKHGRNRTNVWAYPGVLSRRADLKLHPTVKPTALVADAICDVTRHGDLVLDPFGGSGTTLLAAEETGRRAALIEIDPSYVDLIVRRFEEATGQHAVLEQTGQRFAEIAEIRVQAMEASDER
jgi:DNA modification methylase